MVVFFYRKRIPDAVTLFPADLASFSSIIATIVIKMPVSDKKLKCSDQRKCPKMQRTIIPALWHSVINATEVAAYPLSITVLLTAYIKPQTIPQSKLPGQEDCL